MTKKQKWLLGFLAMFFALSLSIGVVTVSADTPETIRDECNVTSGGVINDLYGYSCAIGDVGFGEDGRYLTTKAPIATPTLSTMWDAEYAYVQYAVSGQNVVKVSVVVAPEAIGKLEPVLVFASGGGNVLEVNNTVVENSDNWTKITYTYIITDPANATWVRVLTSVYNDNNEGLETWMQQITEVEISYMETLPEKDSEIVIDTIEDNCDAAEGAIISDLFGYAAVNSDVGFGADGRYMTGRTPTAAPDIHTMWDLDYGYVQYNVSGQNVVKVTVDVAPEAVGKLPPALVFASYGGNLLEVNNTVVENSDNWVRITYTYIITDPENAVWVRAYITAYNDEDEGLETWMQQITEVEISYMETLPEKDSEEPAEPEEPVDIEELKKQVYSDYCSGVIVNGMRLDIFNVTVKADDFAKIGDADRIVFGSNAGAQESYIDYSMNYMDTIVVTAYEEILPENARPANATSVKFAVWQNGSCVAWEVEATSVEVVLGNYETGRWTKVIYTYKFTEIFENASIRVMIYKPVEGQSEQQIGRVDIYNSENADFTKLDAKAELEVYAYAKDSSAYSVDNWNSLITAMIMARTSIDDAEDAASVATALSQAKTDIDSIKTLAQEFEEVKEQKKSVISDYALAKGIDNYSEENWASILACVTEAQNKIDNATTIDEIEDAIQDAKEEINLVERIQVKPGEPGNEPIDEPGGELEPEKKGGCGSEITGSDYALFVVALLSVGAIVIFIRKKSRE